MPSRGTALIVPASPTLHTLAEPRHTSLIGSMSVSAHLTPREIDHTRTRREVDDRHHVSHLEQHVRVEPRAADEAVAQRALGPHVEEADQTAATAVVVVVAVVAVVAVLLESANARQ